MSFPRYRQLDSMDCGPTCLRMIAKYYGGSYSMQFLRERAYISREGVSMEGIINAAESIGFRTLGVRITVTQLIDECPLPCILHWNKNHFVVCHKIEKKKGINLFHIADPGTLTPVIYTEEEFSRCWINTEVGGKEAGLALLLEPSPEFYKMSKGHADSKQRLSFFFKYLTPYKKELFQLVAGMLVASGLQLIVPFLTQALVDKGIKNSNLNLITLILIAQLLIFLGGLSVDFVRNRILLYTNTKINITLISDFLAKLTRLPLHFFDTKKIGDIMQRIGDHSRIESFLTGSSLTTFFSLVNFIVFSFVLAYYNLIVFALFVAGNSLYVIWILFFMKYRRELDIKRFAQAAGEQSNLYQLITGMQEIKLNNSEDQKRWKWKQIQIKLFRISLQSLKVEQYQKLGSAFFNQTTNILITFMAARTVVSGEMTLGMMMSITYIVGQLNAPIEQFISFVRAFQDAQISLERLNEIHQQKDEEQDISTKANKLPEDQTIQINHLHFSYSGQEEDNVLADINLTIPEKKVTAIVGASGSGKTTLIKLLLGFYSPQKGDIRIGNLPLDTINPHLWREKTGAVMQDGYIFSDTITENIAVGQHTIDQERLQHAVSVANIKDYIESLPLKYNTTIGIEGNGVSQGQRQRILIARAVYKNPKFIFLDEATNALDANNEKGILEHLQSFYKGRTVIIVAHRLSTVKDADKIVVLDHGQIVEEGTHAELTLRKGVYYKLVKNQLELGL
ncbi:peptidase domain-containing ABC transporter [uncultured Parabacteroides sp.]|uniref:peptidase domain-containing ABC transporter n=1 Tax=uncultured Parabacteroides sp. TaxID=512312 RepID=UPI0025D9EF92|nr:peptidase domain-containing ABC transporter [uncultured Parabacteroides sp.]